MIDAPILIPAPTEDGTWRQFNLPWNSGESLSATIQIYVTRTDISGNDGTLDDLSFTADKRGSTSELTAAPVPEPASMTLFGIGAGILLRRKRR